MHTPKIPLRKLLVDLKKELVRLGYSLGSLCYYQGRWKRLLAFLDEKNVEVFSEQLGLDFIKHSTGIDVTVPQPVLSKYNMQTLRVVRMIGDFQLHGTIARRYYRHHDLLKDPHAIETSNEFRNYCEQKDYSTVTVEHYVGQTERFLDYLLAQNISDWSLITVVEIDDYIKTLAGYSYKTVEQNVCSIRAFLRFLFANGLISTDLALKTPKFKARKQTRIPSVWTHDELKRLIAAIDRANPKGKRDYAMILLACVLGLRVGDIKKMTFSNFSWADKTLTFIQSKTRTEITLPLPNDVGWAVIDYLKNGRPPINSDIIFVRHLAPFLPFSHADHLSQIIQSYMRIAHLPTLKKRRGMHSLRHTAAARMLEAETPLPVISDILGHSDTDSTSVYLKVDIGQLRECVLELPEGDHHE